MVNKEKFIRLIKSIFKFIGIFLLFFFINNIIVAFSFLLPFLYNTHWWESDEIFGIVMLGLLITALSLTILFHLSERFRKICKLLLRFIGVFIGSLFIICLFLFLISDIINIFFSTFFEILSKNAGVILLMMLVGALGFTLLFYLNEKFRKIFKSLLKFGGVLIGSFFIVGLFLSLIFFVFLFCWPSFFKIYWEKIKIAELVILGWMVCLTILFYLSEKFRKIFKPLAIFGLLILIAILAIRVFLIEPFFASDNGLEPYLKEGQYFLIQKLDKSIKKGDIVAVRNEKGSLRIQIVIGLPGDKIELKNGTYFVNGEPLENIVYDLKQFNGIDTKTQNYFIIVPPDHFYGASTFEISTESTGYVMSLDSHIYKNSDVIGKLLFPVPKVRIEKYTGKDSCNGYPPKTCPEGSKYYCPEKGKPFCCSGEIIDGFCIECPPGQEVALAKDKVHKMCCEKNLICNGLCYSGCNVEEDFICDKDFGGFCCPKGKVPAWDANRKNKICCDKNLICNEVCYSGCNENEKFVCEKESGGICLPLKCPPGQAFALASDRKNKMCCDKNLICNGICYAPCPPGQKFYCPPVGNAQCYPGDSIFCNGKYWAPCPSGQKFHCPPVGDPYCE